MVSIDIRDDTLEWLEADGLGGFASGTVSGKRTRRYHALLLASTTPPTGRFVLVSGLDAAVRTPKGTFPISSQVYAPGVVQPSGLDSIESFEADPWPRWRFRLPDGTVVEQEVFVRRGAPGLGRRLVDGQVPVALATDFNPGTCPTEAMTAILPLACLEGGLTPAEAITAATLNAAHSLGLAARVGSLEIGKSADVQILEVPNHLHLVYHFGVNHCRTVVKQGRVVVEEGVIAGAAPGAPSGNSLTGGASSGFRP